MKTCKKGLHQYDSSLKRCPECHKAICAARKKTNFDKIKTQNAYYYKANSDKIKARRTTSRKTNPDKEKAALAAWRKANPDKEKASHAAWQKANPDKVNAHVMKRIAAKLQRTPLWLTEKQFKEIESWYTLAKELQWLSNQSLEVDHIVPLQGENVSGLHVPWNLQILSRSKNASKGNRI